MKVKFPKNNNRKGKNKSQMRRKKILMLKKKIQHKKLNSLRMKYVDLHGEHTKAILNFLRICLLKEYQ